MTREEEAIAELKRDIELDNDFSKEYITAVNIAIKALEQEPNDKYIKEIDHLHKYIAKLETRIVEQESVLGKIKAEIEELDVFYDNDYFSNNKDAMFKRNEILQIIDKYDILLAKGEE